MDEHKTYTKKFLISELHRYKKENGKTPLLNDFVKLENYPSKYYYTKIFGSWNNALKEAGLPYNNKIPTKEFLISELHRFINEFGVMPTSRLMDTKKKYPSANTYKKYFGSWNNALKAAEITVLNLNTKERKHNRESLIKEVKRFYDEFNRVPCSKDFNQKNDYPAYTTFLRYFNSFNEVIEIFKSEYNISESEIISSNELKATEKLENRNQFLKSEIVRYFEEYDVIPTTTAFSKNKDYPSIVAYYDFYDTWYDALIDAGFTEYALIDYKQFNTRMSDKFLLSELLRFKKEFGIVPSIKTFNSTPNYPTSTAYINHFGSWNNALERVGFKTSTKNIEYNNEQLIEKLYDFVKEKGFLPYSTTFKDMDGLPSYNTYLKYFGSWNNVLKTIGFDKSENIEKTEIVQKIIKESLFNYVKENKKIPSFDEFSISENVSRAAINKNFKSYQDFITNSGFYYEEPKIDYNEVTNEELIDILYDYEEEFGKTPTAKLINDNLNYPPYDIYVSRFGSWNDALEVAGMI